MLTNQLGQRGNVESWQVSIAKLLAIFVFNDRDMLRATSAAHTLSSGACLGGRSVFLSRLLVGV
jgi:hypothetical protein